MEKISSLRWHQEIPTNVVEYLRSIKHFGKMLEDFEALLDETDTDFVGVVLPHNGCRIARGASAEQPFLQEYHVSHPFSGQMIQKARADSTSSDNDYIGCLEH